jgi:hypothetical protein
MGRAGMIAGTDHEESIMSYGSDDRYGNRWRGERGQSGRDRDDRGGSGGYGRDDGRGFFDRAGDEVRSWFGDDEAQRRRETDERRWEQEQRMSGGRDNDPRSGGSGWMGGGWGNQSGESWHRDRPGVRGGWDRPGERDRPGGGEGFGNDRVARGGSGFGGYPDEGRRFNRDDPGRVGTSGPMSQRLAGYGRGDDLTRGGFGDHDPHYSEWRRRQIEDLDRDYDEYRREHQSKFEQEFGGWREKRQSQRQLLGKVAEHMEVVGSDGGHVGTVDKVRGDRIILAKSDPNAGGMHHSVPCGWVETVEDKVILNRTADSAMDAWRNEDNGRALFERGDQGSEGPHALDRSFPGTYGGRNDD